MNIEIGEGLTTAIILTGMFVMFSFISFMIYSVDVSHTPLEQCMKDCNRVGDFQDLVFECKTLCIEHVSDGGVNVE